MNKRAKEIIDSLELSSHPEGGFYKETYRSSSKLKSPRNGLIRNALTDIYFLLTAGQTSRFHRLSHDEIWHFYEGAPLRLIEIEPDSLKISDNVLGSLRKLKYKHCVKADSWQAARSLGEYSLVGCSVAPGFDFEDFSFLKDDQSARSKIQEKYPRLVKFL